MGLRITTWNVNGIRNPFGYQPWRDKRSFEAMFNILEADIVVLQEIKIQRKDLSDDMVLVPGWDCYFTFPRNKKGYSGVAIYTRQSVCAPIRAEEGITGLLCLPNSSTAFADASEKQQVGGYPSFKQLDESSVDAVTLDSEGRCIILEFPAFVLLGVYCPANRDETRDDFRLGFLNILDARIRNLISMGKRVILAGDLNISRDERDAANAEASMRKQGLEGTEFVSTPARRLFNQLLEGGKVFGKRDEGRGEHVMWDICRAFHPGRRGMFTCWEQKVNARPGNCGARIDYVLCSLDIKDWFSTSNIQEGLMGSDHCPVYAVIKELVLLDGKEFDIRDLMNPPEMFLNGERQRAYSTATDPRQLSGRLLTEFSGRRNIRDMFSRGKSTTQAQSPTIINTESQLDVEPHSNLNLSLQQPVPPKYSKASLDSETSNTVQCPNPLALKRSAPQATVSKTAKRSKSSPQSLTASASTKGQQSLNGFFKSKPLLPTNTHFSPEACGSPVSSNTVPPFSASILEATRELTSPREDKSSLQAANSSDISLGEMSVQANPKDRSLVRSTKVKLRGEALGETIGVHDPIITKESWSKLFTKPRAPRCEVHDEPCISMLTKKQGINLGRSFWMCSRPLGPSGTKEKNSQWRCGTFIWCSDWNPSTANAV